MCRRALGCVHQPLAFFCAFWTALRETLVAGLPSRPILQPLKAPTAHAPAKDAVPVSPMALLASTSVFSSGRLAVAPSDGVSFWKRADAPG